MQTIFFGIFFFLVKKYMKVKSNENQNESRQARKMLASTCMCVYMYVCEQLLHCYQNCAPKIHIVHMYDTYGVFCGLISVKQSCASVHMYLFLFNMYMCVYIYI